MTSWDDTFAIAAAVVPERAQAVIGTPVTFSTHLVGAGLTYRWQTKYEHQGDDAWVDIPGAAGASLQVVTGDFYMFCAQYRAIVSSPLGEMTSASATLVNQLPPPVFTLDLPRDVTVPVGATLTLSVATDPSASFYVWKRNGVNVDDGTFGSNSYTTPPLTAKDDNATYSVEAVRYAGNHQCTQHGKAMSQVTTVHVVP
ncbi:MAG: immunoglobulin domain-containing protein [Polyangiaceae bacterium]